MKCPHCAVEDSHGVYRKINIGNLYVRQRVCDACGRRFYTDEQITKRQPEKSMFDSDGDAQADKDAGTE